MANFAASTLFVVFQKFYAAATGVQSNKKACKHLAERVRCIEEPLLAKAQTSDEVHSMATRILTEITQFLLSFNAAKTILHWRDHASNTAAFKDFHDSLTRVVGNIALIASSVQLQDSRDDFEQQQIINKQNLSIAEAETANKLLQLDAPKAFTGFVEIDYDTLNVGRQLGHGSFGLVYKSKWQGKDVAVKYFNTRALDAATIRALRHELRVHASPQVQHERIIALHGASTVAPHYALVMEYAPYGSLHDLLHSEHHSSERAKLTVVVRTQILADIAVAVQHLHNNKIVHGDIKSSNALVCNAEYRAKVCDFGFATVNSSVSTMSNRDPKLCGTAGYIAPEILNGETSSTYSSDTYSYGLVMYEVITETMPFAGISIRAIDNQVCAGKRPIINDDVVVEGCAELQPLLEQCWHHTATLRPEFNAIVTAFSDRGATIQTGQSIKTL
jgi:serine/threonine protein kinase